MMNAIGGGIMTDVGKRGLLTELNEIYRIHDLDLSAVNLEICPEDTMFTKGDEDHYFNVGLSCLKSILLALSSAQKDKSGIKTILDFPSGWGRELRFIKAYFPDAEITAGDLEEGALRFCKDQFDAVPLLSRKDFSRITLVKKFDLIWCGSLLTHLNEDKALELLNFFHEALNKDGILSFTSQGRFSNYLLDSGKCNYGLEGAECQTLMQQYELRGYGFVNYLGAEDYGISLIKPSHIIKMTERNKNWKLIMYSEKKYDNHQDVISFLKEPVSNICMRPWLDRWIKRQESEKL